MIYFTPFSQDKLYKTNFKGKGVKKEELALGYDLIIAALVAGLFVDPDITHIPEEERVGMIKTAFSILLESFTPDKRLLFKESIDKFYQRYDNFNDSQLIIDKMKESDGT